MNRLSRLLKEIQKNEGHQSAKSFYQYLNKRGLNINYAHFMKIFNGKNVANETLVSDLARILKKYQDDVILSHCEDMFPKHHYLFKLQAHQQGNAPFQLNHKIHEVKTEKVQTLSMRQISTLAKCRENYFLFLIFTMSRIALATEEAAPFFKGVNIINHLETLVDEGIIVADNGKYHVANTEVKFPPRDSHLEIAYKKFDQWDKEFTVFANFHQRYQKMILRRVSTRYLSLIENHLNLILELTKIADESDLKHNNQVVHLILSLEQGKLPG